MRLKKFIAFVNLTQETFLHFWRYVFKCTSIFKSKLLTLINCYQVLRCNITNIYFAANDSVKDISGILPRRCDVYTERKNIYMPWWKDCNLLYSKEGTMKYFRNDFYNNLSTHTIFLFWPTCCLTNTESVKKKRRSMTIDTWNISII